MIIAVCPSFCRIRFKLRYVIPLLANTGKRHQNNYEDLGSRNECKCSDIDAWCLDTYLSVNISYYIIRDII